jgi:hypothetical protein
LKIDCLAVQHAQFRQKRNLQFDGLVWTSVADGGLAIADLAGAAIE